MALWTLPALLGGEDETTVILQGHSYPPGTLTDVIAAEARQGRRVRIAIQHAGGWAISEGVPMNCPCRIYIGGNPDCPVHGGEELAGESCGVCGREVKAGDDLFFDEEEDAIVCSACARSTFRVDPVRGQMCRR